MNTEKLNKLERLKKQLDNKLIPDGVKDKIRNEIEKLESEIKSEDITATELKKEVAKVEEKVEVAVEKAEKKAESSEPKKGRGRPRKTPATTPVEPKATETAIKKTAMSVAKTIRKDGEEWSDAMKRANGVMKKEKVEAKKTTKSELDRLLARVRKNKSLMSELKDVKSLGRDAVRQAKPVGKRISEKGRKNGYGTTEGGNVYYEYRANKTDRKNYGKYAFADGGNISDVTYAIFNPNQKNGKIETSFGDKTKEGLFAMISNVNYYPEEISKAIFDANDKNGKIKTTYGDKTFSGLTEMIKNVRNTFELGGSVVTDLAGHTGGGNGGFNARIPLDGFSNTSYTGLVGETGAMSSGEMFADGGQITISEIKRRTSETSPYFFDAKTMKFFNQKMSDFKVRKLENGKYEIYAPRKDYNGKSMGVTKRIFNPETNELEFTKDFADGGSINEKTTKMRKQRLKKGDNVFVVGRRWFDRVNGNTYHTAEVEVNGIYVGKSRMTYGYGDQYLETAKEILLEKYDFPKGMTDRSSLWQLREYGVVLNKSVIDGLKRDLEDGGFMEGVYAKGGGVRIVNGREYPTGRNWTNEHRHIDKADSREVNYKRKGKFLGIFNDGGAMQNFKYDDVLEVLKEKLEGAIDDLPMDYENSDSFTGEEVEKQSRDGFIAYTNGGYEVNWFENMSMFTGSGKSLPTKPLDTEMDRQVAYNYEYAKERFVEEYPEIVEELGEDNIDYNSLYEAGYEDEAEQLSEWEMNYDGDDTILCEIGAYYYDTDNYRGIDEKHTIRLFGYVNLESPYHRRGNLDDSYDIDITFDSISELKEKVDAGLKEIIDWFDGKYYNDSTTEMKIRRMADGGSVGMANQQVIDDASQSYVNYYLGEGASAGIYKDGGKIENQYEDRTPKDIWNSLSEKQREHFLLDHYYIEKEYFFQQQKKWLSVEDEKMIKTLSLKNWDKLESDVKKAFTSHVKEGQYAKGGGLSMVGGREYPTGRNWTNEHRHIDKADSREVNYKRKKSFAKGGAVSPFKNMMETNTITEKEINLIKLRMNNDKVDDFTQEAIDFIWENSPQLTPDQNKKGIDYLRNLWKSPTGKERVNSPFGYREENVLETFEYFELRGFYDAGNRYNKFYVPLYTCVGADSSFEYAFYGGKVNILG